MVISKKAQEIANRQIIETDAMSAVHNDIVQLMHDAPTPDFAEISAFKLEMNNWLWERKDVLDYYKLVDAVNASIYAASDKAAKMAEWREWATKTRLALRYLDGVVELGHDIKVSQLELAWNIRAFNEKILPAWAEFDALRQGVKQAPRLAEMDESGQRFDDENYLPF